MVGVVLVEDARMARGGQPVPGDLDQPGAGAGHDGQFLAHDAAPHLRPDMPGRGGVAHRPEPDGLVIVDQPLLPKRQGIRLGGQDVQVASLDL